jgi:thiaminase
MELAQAEAAFLRVAKLEKAFWQMAYGEGVRVDGYEGMRV